MKKIMAMVVACTTSLLCVACGGVTANTDTNTNANYTVTFMQDGNELASYSVKSGTLLSTLQNVPVPQQPTDTTLVAEWSYDKESKCTADMTIETTVYTSGLQFYSYYSGEVNAKGYEVAAGYEGTAEHIVIPDYYKGLPVLKIADKAFDGSAEGNYSIKKVTLPDTLVEIGNQAFNRCKALTDLEIPSSLRSLGTNVFYEVPLSGTLTLSGEIEVIPSRCFQGTRYSKVVLEEGITELGAHCFTMGYTLETVILPKSIQKIDAVAFWLQPVEKFFYAGTEDDWIFVEISSSKYPNEADRDNLESYLEKGTAGAIRGTPEKDENGNRITKVVYPTLYFYSETKPTGEGNFWHFSGGQPAIW